MSLTKINYDAKTSKTILDFEDAMDTFIYNVYTSQDVNRFGFISPDKDNDYCNVFVSFMLYQMQDIYNNIHIDNKTKLHIIELWNRVIRTNTINYVTTEGSYELL